MTACYCYGQRVSTTEYCVLRVCVWIRAVGDGAGEAQRSQQGKPQGIVPPCNLWLPRKTYSRWNTSSAPNTLSCLCKRRRSLLLFLSATDSYTSTTDGFLSSAGTGHNRTVANITSAFACATTRYCHTLQLQVHMHSASVHANIQALPCCQGCRQYKCT